MVWWMVTELRNQLTSLVTPATAWSTFASISFNDTFHSPPPSRPPLRSVWSLWSWPRPASQLEPLALWMISGRRRNRKILRVLFFCLMPAWVRERKVKRGSRPFFLSAKPSYQLYAWSSEASPEWQPELPEPQLCVLHILSCDIQVLAAWERLSKPWLQFDDVENKGKFDTIFIPIISFSCLGVVKLFPSEVA